MGVYKFKLGDKVWRIRMADMGGLWWVLGLRETIRQRHFSGGYAEYDTSRTLDVPEDELFTDWDDAQNECTRRCKE